MLTGSSITAKAAGEMSLAAAGVTAATAGSFLAGMANDDVGGTTVDCEDVPGSTSSLYEPVLLGVAQATKFADPAATAQGEGVQRLSMGPGTRSQSARRN